VVRWRLQHLFSWNFNRQLAGRWVNGGTKKEGVTLKMHVEWDQLSRSKGEAEN